MAAQFSMGDLRRSVARVYSEELTLNDSNPISNKSVIARIKKEHAEEVSLVAEQLIERQINKMIHDARAGLNHNDNGLGADLFGQFPHVKRSVSVRKGETKALENVTVAEFRNVMQRQAERAAKKLENDDLNQLWNLLQSYIRSDSDTIADLWNRRGRD